VDVRELTADSIRETLGLVTQDGHLFHDSVRANLQLARPDATDDEFWDVLRRARLEELMRSLPDGLETIVGERGYRLSGGDRQRLTIARLLLARPRVVILDEATAHLDATSEIAVQAALDEALDGRTAIVIAHRLSTVRAADLIMVLEEGRIVERGTHHDLLAGLAGDTLSPAGRGAAVATRRARCSGSAGSRRRTGGPGPAPRAT
jgi:ATP-binding cassette, subfamily B, bacterial